MIFVVLHKSVFVNHAGDSQFSQTCDFRDNDPVVLNGFRRESYRRRRFGERSGNRSAGDDRDFASPVQIAEPYFAGDVAAHGVDRKIRELDHFEIIAGADDRFGIIAAVDEEVTDV